MQHVDAAESYFLRGGPPSPAARLSARTLLADDLRRLGVNGRPVTPAEERKLLSRGWTR